MKYSLNSIKHVETLCDEEILGALFFPRLKPEKAKIKGELMLRTFGNYDAIFNSSEELKLSFFGKNSYAYKTCLLAKEMKRRSLKRSISNKNIVSSLDQLISYLQEDIGYADKEYLRILFLNKKNHLLADEVASSGTIDCVHIYPRELIKRILFHSATSVILVHNHPSGDPMPSKHDIEFTARFVETCKGIGVLVYDHIIVTSDKYFRLLNNKYKTLKISQAISNLSIADNT